LRRFGGALPTILQVLTARRFVSSDLLGDFF